MVAALKGPSGQTALELGSGTYVIGRATDNQLVVNDARVSSHHAEIRPDGQGYSIIDLGSSNGTFVNEQRLVPNMPRQLLNGDAIRVGDSGFVYEAASNLDSSDDATVVAAWGKGGNPAYSPTSPAPPPPYIEDNYGVQQGSYTPSTAYYGNEYGAQQGGFAPPPPYNGDNYGVQQGGYPPPLVPPAPPSQYPEYGAQQGENTPYPPQPPVPAKKPSRRGLWITLAAILAVLVIAGIVVGVIGYANRSTPTKTLNAFCSALKSGDYTTAYNQLTSGLQAKYGSETVFANAFSSNGGLGKITNCSVATVNDGAGSGTMNYTFAQGNPQLVDYTLVNENSWKINAQNPHSSSTFTLTDYCNALNGKDYQTAYNQFSSSYQSQNGSESSFVAAIGTRKLKGCTVNFSTVNDAAGTGGITYTTTDGNNYSANAKLVKENGTWKINDQQFVSSPTLTLLNYCYALKTQDYQAAYAQLSTTAQSQETEAQFAANFNSVTVQDCVPTNVNDSTGTASINYTLNGGRTVTLDYTLVNESGSWKINTEKTRS